MSTKKRILRVIFREHQPKLGVVEGSRIVAAPNSVEGVEEVEHPVFGPGIRLYPLDSRGKDAGVYSRYVPAVNIRAIDYETKEVGE